MLNQMITELTTTLDAINIMPLIVLIAGVTIFYVGYAWTVNKN